MKRMNRRTFVKAAAGTIGAFAFGSILSKNIGFQIAHAQPLDPAALEKFVDALPIPGVQQPALPGYYEIAMTQVEQKLHRDLPLTAVWGYNGTYPGPTIEAYRDEPVQVKWINDLPGDHLLTVDTRIPGAEDQSSRNVVHLHGAHVRPESDGYPENWFRPGESALYEYPNSQPGTTLWYHDHAIGITRLNTYAGLAGFYIIRDDIEEHLNLPSGNYEIPIVLQDRTLNTDGSLFYPETFMPEFFGNAAVVNGKIWPYLEVEPRKYRFRFLNGSTSRFYNLKLLNEDSDGPSFYQIGSDGGLLDAPVRIGGRLLLAPAERADVVVDFSGYEGESLLLHNKAKTPFENLNQETDEVPLPDIMRFNVKDSVSAPDTSFLPSRLTRVPRIPERSAVKVRDLTLQMRMKMTSGGMLMQHLLNGSEFRDPVTEKPQLGTTEIWRFINLIDDAHPIHLHLVQFQILDRQPFDVAEYKNTKQLVFTGAAVKPAANEAGWKDTVVAFPGEVTRIIARFGNFAGRYVWHCHILEHEDYEMMRPFEVVQGNKT